MLIILGSGGFAREVAFLLGSKHGIVSPIWRDCFNFYSEEKIDSLYGRKVFNNFEDIKKFWGTAQELLFIPGIGSPDLKYKLVQQALKAGLKPRTCAIDVTARTDRNFNNNFGNGTVICANSSVTVDVIIGDYVNINLNCTIGHDTKIGDYSNLSPGCNISGNVTIEEFCDLGTGAIVLPEITIGHHSVIGAGSVITKDIPPYSLAVGTPAKVIKTLKED